MGIQRHREGKWRLSTVDPTPRRRKTKVVEADSESAARVQLGRSDRSTLAEAWRTTPGRLPLRKAAARPTREQALFASSDYPAPADAASSGYTAASHPVAAASTAYILPSLREANWAALPNWRYLVFETGPESNAGSSPEKDCQMPSLPPKWPHPRLERRE